MLTIALGGTVKRSSKYSGPFYSGGSFYFTEPLPLQEVDLGYIVQGGSAPELNWNEVYNLHVDGAISTINSEVLHRLPDKIGDYAYGGWKQAGYYYVPVGSVCIFSRKNSAANVSLGAVLGYYDDDSEEYHYCMFRCDVNATKQSGGAHKGEYLGLAYRSKAYKTNITPSILGVHTYSMSAEESVTQAVRQISLLLLEMQPSDLSSAIGFNSYVTAEQVISPDRLLDYARHDLSYFKRSMIDAAQSATPELHATAFDAVQKFDGNLLVLLSKLNSFGTVTLSSLRDFALSSGSAKDAASLWLATRYGDRLSIGGVSSLIDSIITELQNDVMGKQRYVITSSRSYTEFDDGYMNFRLKNACQLAVSPKDYNALMKLIRTAYEWDGFPSLSNVWDAIPLSFVVDWFANIGDIYRSVDRMVASRYYDVHLISQSMSAEMQSPILGGMRAKYYSRTFSKYLQLGVDSVKLGLPSAINIIDGAALVIGFS